MFEVLVASNAGALAGRGWPSRTASAVLHAGLITAAVFGTKLPPPTVDPGPRVFDVHWPAPATPAAPRAPDLPAAPGAPVVHLPVFTLPPTLPPVSPPIPGPGAVPDLPVTLPGIAPPGTPGISLPGLPIQAFEADEAPVLVSHPAVRYPEVLRQAGLEGQVIIEVVLDTLGRAEPGSVRVVRSAHVLFADEAAAVVLRSRYRPARVGGRPVRVRVAVPVAFTLQARG